MPKSTVFVVSAAKYLLKEKRFLLTVVGVFAIFTLFTAPLFSMIAFTRGGEGFIQQVVDSDPYYFLRQASASEGGEQLTQEEPTGEVVDEPPPPPPSPDECPPGTHLSPGTAGQCIPDEPTGGTTGGGEEPPTIGGEPLSASFSIDSTNGDTAPATFLFEADAQGGTSPYSYSWNFGDGQQGSEIFIHHTYEQAGTYTVTLTVTDSAGQTLSDTRQVTVRPTTEQPPPTNATTPLPPGCVATTAGILCPPGENVQAVPQTPTPVNQTAFDDLFNDYCIAGTGGTEEIGSPTPTFPGPSTPCIPCDPGLGIANCVYRDPFGLAETEPLCPVETNQALTMSPQFFSMFAANAGKIHEKGLQFLSRLANETQGDPVLMANSVTKRLEDMRLIKAEEAQQLNAIYNVLADNQTALSEKIDQVGSIYNALSNNPSSCPMAITIAGITLNSLDIEERQGEAVTGGTEPPFPILFSKDKLSADANGAELGGLVGAIFGGVAGLFIAGIGAGPGSVVGGLSGAAGGAIVASFFG